MKRIPVTILTGFLGAGKTTLLNHIIQQNQLKKIAIIENEFGEISIDSDLVIKSEDGIYELSNGCICCSLNGELISILLKLINSQKQIDHLVIETTGIADPGPVAISFISDFKIQSMFRLDAIVTLVDAGHIEQQLENTIEANKQIAIADVVLLNKIDQVELYQKDTVRNIISRINSQAKIIECTFGQTNEINVLEINGFEADTILKTKFETDKNKPATKKFSVDKNRISMPSVSYMADEKTVQHSSLGSYSFVFPEPLDVIKFDTWIKVLLGNAPFQVFRAKGIMRIEDFDKKIVFQAVYNQYVTESGGDWGEELPMNKFVFIGRHLDQQIIEEGLKLCISNEDNDGYDEDFYEKLLSWQEKMYDNAIELGE